jgi:hypothetical protein
MAFKIKGIKQAKQALPIWGILAFLIPKKSPPRRAKKTNQLLFIHRAHQNCYSQVTLRWQAAVLHCL